jgi:hypothetical protein
MGSGSRIILMIVDTKIANRCHASRETPSGEGINHIIIAIKIAIERRIAIDLGDRKPVF